MTDYPCGKFDDCSFSSFSSIVRTYTDTDTQDTDTQDTDTDTQDTDRQTRMNASIFPRLSLA